MRTFIIRRMLINTLYDANRLLADGKVKECYNVLKHKVAEIQKLQECKYYRYKWK